MFWGIRINNYLCLISSISSEIVEIERDKKNAIECTKKSKNICEGGGCIHINRINKIIQNIYKNSIKI